MNKNIWRIVIAVAMVCVLSHKADAQFETGKVYLGPHLGLGAYEASVSFGGHIEYGLTQPGDAGPGQIGIGGTVDYMQWHGDAGYGYSWTYSWLPMNFFGAYHFALGLKKWDLFAGLGLGYVVFNQEWHSPDGVIDNDDTTTSYGSHFFWSGVAGARYFFTPGLSAQARLGWGISILSVGVDFTL